jgi:nitric oxide reductase NorE protein
MAEVVEAEVCPADAMKTRHIPGEPGIWVLLFGDMAIFTTLFAVYLHAFGQKPALFAASQEHLNRNLGAANTLVLLTSSLLIVFATRAARRPAQRHLAARLTLAGVAVGSCFVVIKVLEYYEKLSTGITPGSNEFCMYYYVLTGLHLAHVVVGLTLLTILSRVIRAPNASLTRVAFFEGGACFWHMVDLLWLIIFPLVFLVR